MVEAFSDLSALRAFHEALDRIDPTASPAAMILSPRDLPRIRRLGVLSGSFDPPTCAHHALLASARRDVGLDLVLFTLSRVIIDKEAGTGLLPADRLLLLTLLTRGHEGVGVALTSHGLYVEQALAFRALFPEADLWFVVGFDKALQIFDPQYYADRDAALRQLFSLASLAVAPRGPRGADDLRRLLDRPQNAPYRSRVIPLDVPPAFRDLSSTRVREALARGEPPTGLVPSPVEDFLARTGAYRPPVRLQGGEEVGVYALRGRALALFVSGPGEEPADFPRLMTLAIQDSPTGREIRRQLSRVRPNKGDEALGAIRRLLATGPEGA